MSKNIFVSFQSTVACQLARFAAGCCIKMAKSPQRTPSMSKSLNNDDHKDHIMIIIIIFLKLQKRPMNLLRFKGAIHLFGIFSQSKQQ